MDLFLSSQSMVAITGLDALLANSNDLASATRVILLEIKSSTANSVPFSIKLGAGYNGYQLDNTWLAGVANKMEDEIEKTISKAGEGLNIIIRNKPAIIEKYVIEVDREANAKILRIE